MPVNVGVGCLRGEEAQAQQRHDGFRGHVASQEASESARCEVVLLLGHQCMQTLTCHQEIL